MLKKFILFFKDQAKNLIKTNNKSYNRLIFPEFLQDKQKLNKNLKNLAVAEAYKKKLINQLHSKSYLITTPTGDVRLSNRELQCLHYHFRGRTAAETATIMKLSPKTVEYYLGCVKMKLDCQSKGELFDRIWELDLARMIVDL